MTDRDLTPARRSADRDQDDANYHRGRTDAELERLSKAVELLGTHMETGFKALETRMESVKVEFTQGQTAIFNNYVSRASFQEWRDNFNQDTQRFQRESLEDRDGLRKKVAELVAENERGKGRSQAFTAAAAVGIPLLSATVSALVAAVLRGWHP